MKKQRSHWTKLDHITFLVGWMFCLDSLLFVAAVIFVGYPLSYGLMKLLGMNLLFVFLALTVAMIADIWEVRKKK